MPLVVQPHRQHKRAGACRRVLCAVLTNMQGAEKVYAWRREHREPAWFSAACMLATVDSRRAQQRQPGAQGGPHGKYRNKRGCPYQRTAAMCMLMPAGCNQRNVPASAYDVNMPRAQAPLVIGPLGAVCSRRGTRARGVGGLGQCRLQANFPGMCCSTGSGERFLCKGLGDGAAAPVLLWLQEPALPDCLENA